MIDLYLSSDGKHTVHVAAESPEELDKLTPAAKALYEAVIKAYGNKAQMWGAATGKNTNRDEPGKGLATAAPATISKAPLCPVHHQPMAYRQGRYGAFWSCRMRQPNGHWCRITKEARQPDAMPVKTAEE